MSLIVGFRRMAMAIAALTCTVLLMDAGEASARPGEPLRIVVLGDSLGDGVWIGLTRLMSDHDGIDVVRRSRVSTGFARPDFYDWNAELPGILEEGPVDAAVVVMGTNDQQPMRVGGARAAVLSDGWRAAYEARARAFAEELARRGIATYWIGLPIMRAPDFSRNVKHINGIFKAVSGRYGLHYIDTWRDFADARGRYSAHGPDATGRTRRLRANDGIHFTTQGYVRLAKPVADAILASLGDAAGPPPANAPRSRPAPPPAVTPPGGPGTPLPTMRPEPALSDPAAPLPALRPGDLQRFTLRWRTY